MTDKYEVGVKLRGERGGKVSRSNTYYKTNQTTNAAQRECENVVPLGVYVICC